MVTVVLGPADMESELEISISAVADGAETEVTRTVTVLPWADDRGPQAREILSLFTDWLAENRPDLGIAERATHHRQLHRCCSWCPTHVLDRPVGDRPRLARDDAARRLRRNLLRPRNELKPTMAFRLGSWQTALETGEVEIGESSPPAEVVR